MIKDGSQRPQLSQVLKNVSGLFRQQMDQVDVALRHNFMDSFNDKGRVSTMLMLGKMVQYLEKNDKCVKNV